MIVSTVSMAIAEPVTIAKTVSMTVSKIVLQIGDRWWNRVSIMTIAHCWCRISRSICDLCDSRCGVRQFGDGCRCNELSDCRGNRDLKRKLFHFTLFRSILFCFVF